MTSSISGNYGSNAMTSISDIQERMFKKADTSGDGIIEKGELSAFQTNLYQSGLSGDDISTQFDSDQDGSITRAESDAAIAKLFYGIPPDGPLVPLSTIGNSSETNATTWWNDVFGKLDTSGDGSVSKAEFVANRPQNISEDQATQMWSLLDTSGSGSLTQSQFVSAMVSQGPPPGPPGGAYSIPGSIGLGSSAETNEQMQAILTAMQQYVTATEQTSSSFGNASDAAGQGFSDLFSKIDINGDGPVSKDEFVSARPTGVTEDQSMETWSKIDTSGNGSLNESQFDSAMASQGPPSGQSLSTSTSSTANAATVQYDPLQALLAAIQKYSSTSEQNNSFSTTTATAADSLSIVA